MKRIILIFLILCLFLNGIACISNDSKKKYKVSLNADLFNSVYLPYLHDDRFIQIFFGGSSSGKSKFLAQRVVVDLMGGQRNYLVIRNTAGTILGSIWTEIEKVIKEWGVGDFFTYSRDRANLAIKCGSGAVALFRGLDDVEKIKSITVPNGVLTDILIEEATETIETDFNQLRKRLRGLSEVSKRITMAFNPIMRTHWICERFFQTWNDSDSLLDEPSLLILKTTYKDNRFLTSQDIEQLESEADSYFYEVYTLGNWGILGDLIFDNWEVADLTDKFFMFDIFNHGLDFGYSNDPTAYVKSYFHKASKTLYIWKEYANKGVTNEKIATDVKPMVGDDILVCDSAEPKSIDELCTYNLNAVGARKGKDSVMHGIQWLRKLRIVIHKSCQNTINNFKQYHWLKDRQGIVLNKPVDRFNDFIDATRYGNEEHMIQFDDDIIEAGESVAAGADWDA